MKKTAALLGTCSAGILTTQLFMPLTAHAATTYSTPNVQYASTTVNAGDYLANPKHVVANDPWSKEPTSWVPLFYLQEALMMFGVNTVWNGNTLNVTYAPKSWKLPTIAPLHGQPSTGDMQFCVNGDQNGYVRSPKLVAEDPASGKDTTYVPVYYANLFMNKYLSMGVSWRGSSWVFGPQATSGITKTTYSSWALAQKAVTNIQQENGYLDFPKNINPTVDLGYDIKAQQNAAMMHAGYEWNEGRWNVELLYYSKNQGAKALAENVVAYLHTHMLPAPNDNGVIIIKSTTSPDSVQINPKTIVAWQEGNTVYEYQTTNAPTEALQTVINSSSP